MLSKYSNPTCSTRFRYLHEGRLFLLECGSEHSASTSSRGEYFWLCERCSSVMTCVSEKTRVSSQFQSQSRFVVSLKALS